MPGDNACETFKVIAQAVPWLLVIAGWWLVNQQNNRRETRKEVHAALNDLKDKLDSLEKQAIAYHSADNPTLQAGRDIKLAIVRISKFIDRHRLLVGSEKNKAVVKLRQAITRQNFDTHDFVRQAENSEIIESISACKDDLVDALDKHFQDRHQT